MSEFLLTRTEVAKQLRVSLPTLDALVRRTEHPLPCVRIGKRVLFRREAIEDWVHECET